ncbi:uncharacterized protein LOC124360623 [Homalodisca vitripennis]|uniref:uncharacterized protein LOC124360623 n=1 Tax=Homalodisca vitripennis TaxID=197043 RepID=UPI001EEC5250|nr:uncharacterized protein LOC124360623 [Homalodisca vitripennis]
MRPVCMLRGQDILLPQLCRLFPASVTLKYIPLSWRVSTVVFIPKQGRVSLDRPKSFRPIFLSSFLPKTMEKMVARFVYEGSLLEQPLHPNQHAFTTGRSWYAGLRRRWQEKR